MKRLFGILVLTLALVASSSIFIHFSNCLMEPSSADKYNSYFRKWDKAIVDFCMQHKQKGPDYLNRCSDMFDETKLAYPDRVKKCTETCPLPRTRTRRLVRTTQDLKNESFAEAFHDTSNIARQTRIRD